MTTTSCAVKSQVECESTPNATYRGEGTTCPSWCADPTNPDCCDESFKGEIGLVPCGSTPLCTTGSAGGGYASGVTVDCNSSACQPTPLLPHGPNNCSVVLSCPCQLNHVFFLALNVYKFVIWTMALPLTGLLIMIGGILLIVGSGYPKFYDMGKRIAWGAVWGLAFMLSSWIIIGLVLMAIGYGGYLGTSWWTFTF